MPDLVALNIDLEMTRRVRVCIAVSYPTSPEMFAWRMLGIKFGGEADSS